MVNTKIALVTLEEHYVSKVVTDFYASQNTQLPIPEYPVNLKSSLSEIGLKRLKAMNKGRITIQVISHLPNTLALPPEICRAANDELYAAIAASPDPTRFAAFAMLPTAHPESAADELRRCIKELSFVGSMIDNTTNGRYYDETSFWPIFAAHEYLDVPLYLHATPQTPSSCSIYGGNYPPALSQFLAGTGFHSTHDTTHHVLRLFLSGVFDTYPRLKILLGNMGAHLPYTLERTHKLIQAQIPQSLRPIRHLMQVWHSNLYVTTSHMFSMAPMSCLTQLCCADKVLYSVGWPYDSYADGFGFMRVLRSGDLINDEDFENVASRNAIRLLGLRVPDTNTIGLGRADSMTNDGETPWLSVRVGSSSGGGGEDGSLSGSGAILTTSSSTSTTGAGEFPFTFPHSPLETVTE